MPRYDFHCSCGHSFVETHPLAEVPDAAACGSCGSLARRGISAPHLGRGGSAAFALIDRAARSAYEPEVVSGTLPGARPGRSAPITRNPLHQKLPRT